MMNIINVLNYNPLILNQIKIMMNQEIMMNNQIMQMMNMMNNMNSYTKINQENMDNNFEVKKPNENPSIQIIFRKQSNRPISIKCGLNEKVSDIINKYREESGDYDDAIKFIYNAKALHPSLTIKEVGLSENGNISVVVTHGVKGG